MKNKKNKRYPTQYDSVNTNHPKSGVPRWLVGIFILMIILVIGFFFIQSRISNIETAYQGIYTGTADSDQVSNESQKQAETTHGNHFNLLLIGVDYGNVGRLEVERASLVDHFTITRANNGSRRIIIPRNTAIDDTTVAETYVEAGFSGTINQVSSLLDTEYDYVVTIRLAELRRLVESLGGVEIVLNEPVTVFNETFPANQPLTINGRQTELLQQRQEGESLQSLGERERILLDAVLRAFVDKNNVTNLAQLFTEAEGIIATNIPFNMATSIYLGNYDNEMDQMESVTLTGETIETENGPVLQPDQAQLQELSETAE